MAISLKIPLVLVDDGDLVRVSRENPGYRFEREEDGTLYAKRAGGLAVDSSASYKIGKRGAVKSPDASWVSQARIDALTDEERAGFRPLSSDVAMDVNSASDNFKQTVRKTRFYMRHGSTYAVAIDPATRKVVQLGNRPHDLALDFDAIIDA